MDITQEPFDPYLRVIKTEPDVSGQLIENDCSSKTQQSLNNITKDYDYALVFGDTDNISSEYQASELLNVEIKEEVFENEEPNTEYHLSSLLTKIDYDSVCENIQHISTTIKKDLVDVPDIITKQEVSEYIQQAQTDLPSSKSDNAELPDDFLQPCSSKHAERTLKPTTNDVPSWHPCTCNKNLPSSKSRSNRHSVINTNEGPFKCEICSKEFTQKSYLKKHLIFHSDEKAFKCDICSKTFKRKYDLQTHLSLTHSNQTPFQCKFCSKEFKQKSHLQRHFLTHTNEKPFQCEICFKGFSQNHLLQRHLIIHSGEKPFSCDICSKVFAQKSNLQTHLITHTNEKPFMCDICSKGFKRKSDLQTHLITHTDDKPFECVICSKGFKRKSEIQTHLRTHSNEKPFKCEMCSKKFKRKLNLQIHLTTHNQPSDKP